MEVLFSIDLWSFDARMSRQQFTIPTQSFFTADEVVSFDYCYVNILDKGHTAYTFRPEYCSKCI